VSGELLSLERDGWAPLLGEVESQRATYSMAMNNPWLSLIAALSGRRVSTPSTWPVRQVHRLLEDRAVRPADCRQTRPPHRHRGPLVV